MNGSDTWNIVENRRKELHELTEEAWGKEEWELAALGERVLATVEKAKPAAARLIENTQALQAALENAGS